MVGKAKRAHRRTPCGQIARDGNPWASARRASNGAAAAPGTNRRRVVGAAWIPSIFLGNESSALQRRLIGVSVLVRALGQFDEGTRRPLVGDERQKMRYAVEARPALVVGAYDMPGRVLCIGHLEHPIARPGIVIPAPIGR